MKVGDYVIITNPWDIGCGSSFTNGKGKVARIIEVRKNMSIKYRVEFIDKVEAITIYGDDEIKKLNEIETFVEILWKGLKI